MLFKLFRKPAWENKDPSIRATAVASESNSQVLQRLADFARHDPAPEVRRAAIKRLDDLSLLFDRARLDADAGVKQTADQRLTALLCNGDSPLELSARERFLAAVADAAILDQVTNNAAAPQLRRLALEKQQRPALLIERAIKDPAASIRHWLVDRIDDADALERIAEALRKSDKQGARLAKEKSQSLRLAKRDPAALRAAALQLCEDMGKALHTHNTLDDAQWDGFKSAWQGLGEGIEADLQRRADGYFRAVDATKNPLPPRTTIAAAPVSIAPPAHEPSAKPELADERLAKLWQQLESADDSLSGALLHEWQARFDDRFAKLDPAAKADRDLKQRFDALAKRQQQRIDALLEAERQIHHRQVEALQAFEHAVHDNQLNLANAAREVLKQLVTEHPLRDPALKKRLERSDEAHKQLAQWARWSGNKSRARLCDELQQAVEAKMHPDAIASKVKELQGEWARIELPGSEPDGLTRRFRALCHHALAPTRPYFEKRKQLQGEKREHLEAEIERLASEVQNDTAATKLFGTKTSLREALQRIHEIEPAKRGELSRRIRSLLDESQAKIETQQNAAVEAKRGLIAQLKRQLARARDQEGMQFVKQAQQQWKTLGRADRKTDDALWNEFKALVDPVFADARAERDAQSAADQAKRESAESVLNELLALAAADDLHPQDTREQALDARWRELEVDDRGMQQRYRKAQQVILDATAQKQRAQQQQLWDAVFAAERAQFDTATPISPQEDMFASASDQTTKTPSNLPEPIRAALANPNHESIESLHAWLIELETTAGVESPAEFAAEQRAYRLQLLSRKMGRDTGVTAHKSTMDWYSEWLQRAPRDTGTRASSRARVLAAMSQLEPETRFS